MNLSRPQLEAIVDALTVILPARTPADSELHRFFREHKHLGQKDRAWEVLNRLRQERRTGRS